MAHIFISYSRVDHAFTKDFVERLREMFPDHIIWWDNHLLGGDVWWDEILKQIATSDIFIYLLSNESVTSSYCHAEFLEARRLQKRIITVQVRDRTRLTNDLRDIQYVDMKAGMDDAKAQARLVGSINKQVGLIPPRRPKPLWPGRTLRPILPDEKPRSPDDADVDTPTLRLADKRLPTPPQTEKKKPDRRALIAGVVVLGLTVILGVAALLSPLLNTTNTALTETAQVMAQNISDTPTSDTNRTLAPTAVPTFVPSYTLTPTRTSDPLQGAFQLALIRITRNAYWKPVESDFNGVTMVLVPSGCFMMGSNEGDDNEKPVNEQCFDKPFWIDKTEVTNAQFASFNGVAESISNWTENNRPRESISWFEAHIFCTQRGAHLPTEAEWEYVARGPDSLVYPWGNESVTENAVFGANTNQTAVVGSRPGGASWVGAMNMSGNVWEWTSSLYLEYPYNPSHESYTDANSKRVRRGGSWANIYSNFLRAAYRVGNTPDYVSGFIGFRCARDFE